MGGGRLYRGFRWLEENSLAVTGAVSTLVIVWLSASFWHEAYQLRKDAIRLSQGIELENTLSHLSETLAHERGELLLETSRGTSAPALEIKPIGNSDYDANELIDELNHVLVGFDLQPSVTVQTLNQQLQILEDNYNASKPLWQSLERKDPTRFFQNKIALYQHYSNVNEHVIGSMQSVSAAFLPNRNNDEVSMVRDLRSSFWKLKNNISQLEILVDEEVEALTQTTANVSASSLSVSTPAAVVALTHRFHQIDHDLNRLTHIVKSHELSEPMLAKFESLARWHANDYQATVVRLLTPSILSFDNNSLVNDWLKLRQERTALHRSLWSETSSLTESVVNALKKTANRNLIIDTVLLLLCLLLAMHIRNEVRHIKYRVDHDELTRLMNASRFIHLVGKNIDLLKAEASNKRLGYFVIELTKYDDINEALGHDFGQRVLKETADRLRLAAGTHITVARCRGAQFTAMVTCDDQQEALDVSERIHTHIKNEIELNGRFFDVEAHIGIALYPDHASNAGNLKDAADFALLQTTGDNRSNVGVYDLDMAAKLRYKMEVESELVTAIEQNQFELHYQPQVSVSQRVSSQLEALVRWQHPERGFMPPGDFLPIAERSGYMPLIGNLVMREAIRQCAEWNHIAGAASISVAVNVSADHLTQKNFVNTVHSYIDRYQLDPKLLEVEITESLLIQDIEQVTQVLNDLRSIGIKISLDDFGTGYSSLSQLHSLPIDVLKIDRAFVSRLDCPENPSTAIMSTIVRMAKDYHLEIVAEGAETDAQVLMLNNLGVDLIQGYYYSKPVPASDVLTVLDSINRSLAFSDSA